MAVAKRAGEAVTAFRPIPDWRPGRSHPRAAATIARSFCSNDQTHLVLAGSRVGRRTLPGRGIAPR